MLLVNEYFKSVLQDDFYSYGRHKPSRSDPVRHYGCGHTHNALDLKHQSNNFLNCDMIVEEQVGA